MRFLRLETWPLAIATGMAVFAILGTRTDVWNLIGIAIVAAFLFTFRSTPASSSALPLAALITLLVVQYYRWGYCNSFPYLCFTGSMYQVSAERGGQFRADVFVLLLASLVAILFPDNAGVFFLGLACVAYLGIILGATGLPR